MYLNLPTEALRQLPAAVHGPEEGRVTVAAKAHEELLALPHALETRHCVSAARDRKQHIMDEVWR